jgi:hypothetical protein
MEDDSAEEYLQLLHAVLDTTDGRRLSSTGNSLGWSPYRQVQEVLHAGEPVRARLDGVPDLVQELADVHGCAG